MREAPRIRRTTAGALALSALVASLVSSAGTGVADAAPVPQPDAMLRALRESTGGTGHIDRVQGTDRLRFVGTAAGRAIGRPAGVSADAAPETAARAFLGAYGRLFGVRDVARELRVTKTRTGNGGVRTVRFQQEHAGVPVIGGDLVVQLEADNDVLAAYGETTGPPATTSPSVDSSAARATALGTIARGRGVELSTLRTAEPTLAIYDSRLLGGPGLEVPTLVWRTEVTATSGEEMRELVLVDATRGVVALHFEQIAHAKHREVCDNANVRTAVDTCSTPTLEEGGATEGKHIDAVNAYDFAGDTYDFYFGRFGRDSLDDAGMTLTSVVRYCAPSGGCPYANAYWNGTHMVYGNTFASADDVVGHELTHGITDHESSLFYYFQSGAINESLSDVFGELIDQTNGAGGDDAADKWLMGEDLGIGAIRSMSHPPAYGDPDKMSSPYWADGGSYVDAGGVHSNSGVNNKAAFLITDGGSFNGRTVTGLGVAKAARVYYDAAMALTSASEYRDLYNIMQQACTNAVGGAEGITADDCVQVKSALDAVEMSLQPANRTTTVRFAPKCGADLVPVTRFADNFEAATTNWTVASMIDANRTGTYVANTGPYGKWWNPQTSNPYMGWDPTYATSGTKNLWADDAHLKVDSTISRTASLPVSAGSYLQFNHAHGFDAWEGLNYDGGIVEYSTDSGTTWAQVPPSWFTDNGYNGVIYSYPNPVDSSALAGRETFVADSKGYTTSRISLQALAGQSARFRFRAASDYYFEGYGWFIDDVSVYDCTGVTTTALTAARSAATVVAGGSVTISGRLTNSATGVGLAGQPVHVYGRALATPAPGWRKLATVTTSATGGYSYVTRPTVNYEYSARFAGSATLTAATSAATPDVRVAPKVTATFSRTSVSRTGTAYLSGKVSPAHKGARVYLQRRVSGVWKGVTYKSLSSTSGYTFAVRPGLRGTHSYRVVIKAHADHVQGTSATRSLKVA